MGNKFEVNSLRNLVVRDRSALASGLTQRPFPETDGGLAHICFQAGVFIQGDDHVWVDFDLTHGPCQTCQFAFLGLSPAQIRVDYSPSVSSWPSQKRFDTIIGIIKIASLCFQRLKIGCRWVPPCPKVDVEAVLVFNRATVEFRDAGKKELKCLGYCPILYYKLRSCLWVFSR